VAYHQLFVSDGISNANIVDASLTISSNTYEELRIVLTESLKCFERCCFFLHMSDDFVFLVKLYCASDAVAVMLGYSWYCHFGVKGRINFLYSIFTKE
jgi:hypothetical protein